MKFSGFAIFSQIQCFLPSNMSHPPVNSRLKRKKSVRLGGSQVIPKWIPRRRQVEELKRRADERGLGFWRVTGGVLGDEVFLPGHSAILTFLGWLVSPWETHISPWKWLAGRCRSFPIGKPEWPRDLLKGCTGDLQRLGDKAEENGGEKSPGLQKI